MFTKAGSTFQPLQVHATQAAKGRGLALFSTLAVPDFTDPVFVKTSPKRSFSVIQNERFGLFFVKTGSKISGTGGKERGGLNCTVMEAC
jgi:hypothetical protein